MIPEILIYMLYSLFISKFEETCSNFYCLHLDFDKIKQRKFTAIFACGMY